MHKHLMAMPTNYFKFSSGMSHVKDLSFFSDCHGRVCGHSSFGAFFWIVRINCRIICMISCRIICRKVDLSVYFAGGTKVVQCFTPPPKTNKKRLFEKICGFLSLLLVTRLKRQTSTATYIRKLAKHSLYTDSILQTVLKLYKPTIISQTRVVLLIH